MWLIESGVSRGRKDKRPPTPGSPIRELLNI